MVCTLREITGEDEVEMLNMAHKEASETNLRHVMYNTIVYANELGQPAVYTLQISVSGCRDKLKVCCK